MTTAAVSEPKVRRFTREEYYRLGDAGFFKDERVERIGGEILIKYPRSGGEPEVKRWSQTEYYKMAEMGFFEGQRVELIGGEIVVMSPQNAPHASTIKRIEIQLEFVFGPGYWIRNQLPLPLGVNSDPEPDLAVVKGTFEDYTQRHPKSALLVVEIGDSTLDQDRSSKASLYACGGIADYWIVNLPNRQLEIYRQPIKDREQPFGYRYSKETILKSGDKIAPLAKPKSSIEVKKLLPPKS